MNLHLIVVDILRYFPLKITDFTSLSVYQWQIALELNLEVPTTPYLRWDFGRFELVQILCILPKPLCVHNGIMPVVSENAISSDLFTTSGS